MWTNTKENKDVVIFDYLLNLAHFTLKAEKNVIVSAFFELSTAEEYEQFFETEFKTSISLGDQNSPRWDPINMLSGICQ